LNSRDSFPFNSATVTCHVIIFFAYLSFGQWLIRIINLSLQQNQNFLRYQLLPALMALLAPAIFILVYYLLVIMSLLSVNFLPFRSTFTLLSVNFNCIFVFSKLWSTLLYPFDHMDLLYLRLLDDITTCVYCSFASNSHYLES
jgi:ABC-type Na+ efflux pump permease subunit